ncbi:ribosome-recycling factor-like [Salvia splendens]|uniref:ribosome-recycling factor-like n=1 Tax=Salvia splendens TaxID=180675 RepID=UPI001C26ADEE|nr:ribosome-recycling factor-like [Salvia splendens]XP_042001567.1 ribosome-recycling factor-like [Salvia splendens]
MAISIRRALLSSRILSRALGIASVRSAQTFSYLNSSSIVNSHDSVVVDGFSSLQATELYQFTSKRGFAKARKRQIKEEKDDSEEEEDDEEEDDDEGVDLGVSVKANALSQMNAAVDALSRELAKLRTGRASAGMLDHIMVEHYGVKTPLNRMAVVSVLDPKTLSVSPFDSTALKEMEKAIMSSPLGLNPNSDSQRLIVPIPPLTKEHMQAVCKVVVKSSEDVKKSIRRARQKALDRIKKAAPKKESKRSDKDKDASKDKAGPSISEDDVKRLEKEIDDLTKKFIKSAEDMCKAKEKEIRGG